MSWNGSNHVSSSDGFAAKRRVVQSNTQTNRRSNNRIFLRSLLAGLFVIVSGGIILLLTVGHTFERRTTDKFRQAKSAAIPAVKPAFRPANVANVVKTQEALKKPVRLENGVEVVRAEQTTNRNGAVIEKLWLANGKTMRKIQPPKPIFENASDQLIALAISVKPGESMPPLPDLANADDDFVKSLLAPIRVAETDSDEIKELKAKVIEARAYLAQEVKNGGTVREALRKYQADMESYADSHLMAVQEIQKIRESDGAEMAEHFRQKINESFRLRGIPELEAPSKGKSSKEKTK